MPDAGADSAGRHPGASVRDRDGSRDACAESRSEHVPVERAEGTDSAGDPPDALVPQGTPTDVRISWRGDCEQNPQELYMAGKSIKNKAKYKALKRKGMPKSRAAAISNAGKSASRKGGRKGGRKRGKKR